MLSTATKGFSSFLGSGGFGSVYRGRLVLEGDGQPTEIAVGKYLIPHTKEFRSFGWGEDNWSNATLQPSSVVGLVPRQR
jgi:hypothetical protein